MCGDKKTQIAGIIDFCRENDLTYMRYNGRGMFSRECFAVSIPDIGTLWDLAAFLGDPALPTPSTDQLGRGYVAYWPDHFPMTGPLGTYVDLQLRGEGVD